jgi:uncharacterized protein YjbI with pentapeptide repeats
MESQIQQQTSCPNAKFNRIKNGIESFVKLFQAHRKQIFITVILAVIVIILIHIGYNSDLTGFAASGDPKSQNYKPAKTLWDWLQLIIIPAMLASVTFSFNYLQKELEEQRAQTQKELEEQRAQTQKELEEQRTQTQKELEEQRAQTQKELEEQRAIDQEQAGVLNTYIDDLSKLLLDRQLRVSHVDDEVRTIAQTKTLTALDRLNPERKVRILKFLYETKLLEKVNPLIDLSAEDYLEGLDLTNIKLNGAHLKGVSLKGTNLSFAHLAGANLEGAHLEGANLSYAQLVDADLFMAHLDKATTLDRTDFINCNLESAKLREVDLTKAYGFEDLRARVADLRDADLRGLRLRNANLGKAYLEGAKLENADLTDAEIYEGKLKGANLRNAILTRTRLCDADLTDAVVTNEQLEKVTSLRNATLPNGTKNQGQFLSGSKLDRIEQLKKKEVSSQKSGAEKTDHPDESRPEGPSSSGDQRSQTTLPQNIEKIQKEGIETDL